MRECPKCGRRHQGEGLPPSLQDKLNICYICYREKKKESDKDWNDHHKTRRNNYMKIWRKEHPKETAESWRERTRKWRAKKRFKTSFNPYAIKNDS
jgi:hypothetical protein